MSREPESGAMRYSQIHGGHDGYLPEVKPEPPALPPAPKQRNFKIVVEPEKPKPKPPAPTRGYHARAYERAVTKQLTTTEALSAEERQIISGYRLSVGGEAAEAERRRIEREVRGR